MARKLGVLAGGGSMPATVVAAARRAGREVFVVAFEGETDPGFLHDLPHAWTGLGAIGRVIALLHEAQVEEVVMIGPIRRPSLANLHLDLRGMQALARLGWRRRGDDGILQLAVGILEDEGFAVIGADALLDPWLAPEGVLGGIRPSPDALQDIALGAEVATRLGALDIGQAVVVQCGLVLGVEAVEGTDRLLARCAELRRPGEGGVLVKMMKPQQERRADLPTIGARTLEAAAAAALEGVAVHAGHCLIVERAAAIARADALGIFLTGIARPG